MAYLEQSTQFDGYMGAAQNFRLWNHQLRQSMRVLEVNDAPHPNGWDAMKPVGRVPLRGLKGWKGNPLDTLGFTREESGCTF